MDEDFTIRQRDIKIRKSWDINPATKVIKNTKKRQKDNLRKQIQEDLNEFESSS